MYWSPSSLQEQMKLSINPTVPRREGREGQRQTASKAEAAKNTARIQADCCGQEACSTVAYSWFCVHIIYISMLYLHSFVYICKSQLHNDTHEQEVFLAHSYWCIKEKQLLLIRSISVIQSPVGKSVQACLHRTYTCKAEVMAEQQQKKKVKTY